MKILQRRLPESVALTLALCVLALAQDRGDLERELESLGRGAGGIVPALEGRDGRTRGGRRPLGVERPAPVRNNRAATLAAFLAQERRERSTASHMSFLDRGLASSPLAGEVGRIPERLAARARSADNEPLGAPFPERGVVPPIDEEGLGFLQFSIRNASVVVASQSASGLSVRWLGRASRVNDQHWSATKVLQALHVVSAVRTAHPELSAADAVLVDAAKPHGSGVPLRVLLRQIVSYDAGVTRSNSAAGTLGRLFTRLERERWNEQHTGHDHWFRGNYGARTLVRRPALRVGSRPALIAPASEGPGGPNLISSYDLTRLIAMAAWHPHLGERQRIAGADWRGLATVLEAMGHDSARYADAAFDRLGVRDQISDVVIATKLGHGIRSRTGLAETVYSGVVQFNDQRWQPARWRSVCFTLRGEHRSGVTLDAILAAEMTEIVRLVLNEDLSTRSPEEES